MTKFEQNTWYPIEQFDDTVNPVIVYDPKGHCGDNSSNTVFEADLEKDGEYNDPVYSEWNSYESKATHFMLKPLPPTS